MKSQPHPDLAKLVEEVLPIALAAGRHIMQFYDDRPAGGDFIQIKDDMSPVTAADQLSDRIITEGLGRLSVDYPILSEESPLPSYATRSRYTYLWIVDPLDGTKEFIEHTDEFTVHIGLAAYGEVVLGVVYVPVQEVLYFATRGGGAFRQDATGRRPLRCTAVDIHSPGLRVGRSRSHLNLATDVYIRNLDQPVVIPMGSSLKMMGIAEGTLDIYPKIGGAMQEWDTCAPQIIVEEAGGSVLNREDGLPLYYNKADLTQPDFIALGRPVAKPE